MVIKYKNFEIRPYGNYLCWEIFQYRTVKSTKKGVYQTWISTGKYPSTLGDALYMVYELLLKNDLKEKELFDAMLEARETKEDLMAFAIQAKQLAGVQ